MSKIMIITGTSKGIGKYLTEYYLNKGYAVAGCSRSESSIENDNYEHFELDVANEYDVIKMVNKVWLKYKRIDYLVNNAGIASMNHSFLMPLNTVEKIFRTNVFGTFLFCREVGKVMSKNKFGRIINFATVATPLNLDGESAYAASKAAVESFTKILANEYAQFNITVNALGPTPVFTDLIKNVPKEKMQRLIDRQFIKRFGEFEDIANVVDFFLSDKSNFITGQVIFLGGITA